MDSVPPDVLREITSQKRVSDAEFQALHLALQGNTANVVAKILNISAPAVRKRLGEVYQKFGLTESLPGPGKLEVLRNLLREEFDHYSNQIPQTYKDWDGAVNVSKFVGRNSELVTLERYILSERSRLIVLLGIGGVGKTSLAVKLGERVEKSFEYEIWRSLKNRLPLTEFIKSLFDVLCD